ncbi:MAG TPA: energy-coupling factor transporter transmembrane protein EcfT [Candidatus Limosilactobacillus gallistercoris]|jgi:energy-coupling factor transport system permease protein|uniref:energy-coupling factor transporter transmembrane component T family protein n=1 Tax=Limosilactobacillus pontis TaxID=35787 RepID=UPI001C3A60B8|nr:energy-coupling factor transporter transmembrane component T [Limosilactobacillus pontis]MDM8331165.1 energy-coupling factor transporter transmembrane component T [Limosilactobacillus pontis]HJA74486.1 energy-coupling factor transporter transmembrane protein EcfT [Candidatus Limosilactobacillus gallistercoris]
MNPSLKLFLVLIITLEVTFTSHLYSNVVIIILALAYLIYRRVRWQRLAWLIVITLVPALAIFVTIAFFSPGHNVYFAWVLVTRLYVYVLTGSAVSCTTSALLLVRSLEQNCHLPSKFAYGILAALNLFPRIAQEVRLIRIAGQMRGITLHWWSPRLYFKAILAASQWADQMAQAMESHGFVEGQARTSAHRVPLTRRDWLIFFILVFTLQLLIVALP